MKKAGFHLSLVLLTSVLFLCSIPVKSQISYWNPQKALTDSAADNCNPTVVYFFGSDFREHSLLFWERSVDSQSTEIWFKALNDGEPLEPQQLLATAGVHFTHPKTMLLADYYSTTDTSFILFFESDASGNKDLYFIKYYNNGSFTTPQLLSGQAGNDENLSVCNSYEKFAVWESDDKILKSNWNYQNQSFLPPLVISDSGSHKPKATSDFIYWTKDTITGNKLVYLHRIYNNGNWIYNGPCDLYDEGINLNLENCKGFYDLGGTGILSWENHNGINPAQIIMTSDGQASSSIFHLGSPLYNYSSPDIFDIPMIVKLPSYLAFITDSTGNDEVMTSMCFFDQFLEVRNQSNFEGADRNPKFFGTMFFGVYQMNLLWESMRNGHWTLFYTHYDFTLGTNVSEAGNGLHATPNPFDDHISITLPDESGGTILIRNSLNIPVKYIKTNKCTNSDVTSYYWDGTDESGKRVPPGVYYISYSHGTKILTQKIISK